MTKHIVMFSGGIGSWAAAKRVAALYGTNDLTLLFADVGGDHSSPHAAEDEDCYRFIADAAANVGAALVTVSDGRTIWEVFRDYRLLGNARIAKCSHVLKQAPCRKWLKENTDPTDAAIYVGIDWSETHRIAGNRRRWAPWHIEYPMTEPPYLDKADMIAWAEQEGLRPPKMYAEGYPHANCGGGCVRAGQGQFKLLYENNPERFAYWEEQEQELRDHLGKDVAILRDRRGGSVKPLPLSVLRRRIDGQPELVDADDIGGCGCFTEEE